VHWRQALEQRLQGAAGGGEPEAGSQVEESGRVQECLEAGGRQDYRVLESGEHRAVGYWRQRHRQGPRGAGEPWELTEQGGPTGWRWQLQGAMEAETQSERPEVLEEHRRVTGCWRRIWWCMVQA
jgi:hypothetical protein